MTRDGHTLETVIPEIETQIGASLCRIVADRGYRGHHAPPEHKMKVYIPGQKRGVTDAIKRDLRRRSAVEPVIGHAKGEHRMGRNFLKGAQATPPTPSSPPRLQLVWGIVCQARFIKSLLLTSSFHLVNSDVPRGALHDQRGSSRRILVCG